MQIVVDVKRIWRRSAGLGAALLALFAGTVAPNAAHAQATTGRVFGRVVDATQVPVSGARLTVGGTRFAGVSDVDGRYAIAGIPAGTYEIRAVRIGQAPKVTAGVNVTAGGSTRVDITVDAAPTTLAAVVTSASRRVEKITDAPATVSTLDVQAIDASIGNTFASALKEAKGVDFIQVGMTSVAINARGFNSSFNSRFLMVEDGRISVIPESGLPIGNFTPTPKVDLAGMEVLIGPGSALYGPDASNGVLSLRTKDPREFQGATLEVSGGSRSYKDIQGRYAGVYGNWGYKVSGEFQDANDWENFLSYNAGGSIVAAGTAGAVREDALKVPISWRARTTRGTGAIVHYNGSNRLEINAGMSQTDGVGQTNVGRNQLAGWKYNIAQARYTTPHWYFNAYRAQSQSGQSFALNRFGGAQLTPANASLSADSLRMLSDWPSDGRMYAAEVQTNYTVPMLKNTTVVAGAQYRDDVVSSSRQWLTDRVSKSDISNDQTGLYAQSTTPVSRYLDVVLAGRLDFPSSYYQQWSPKAGVVVKPVDDHAFRVTFNRAFKSPTILQTNFFIPDWTSIISIYGNTDGFTVKNAAGTVTRVYNPIQPESNRTWEFGYKGIIANRLYLDGTYFNSSYENFTSPLTVIANPFAAGAAATWASPTANPNGIPVDAQGRIVNQAGAAPIVLIYYNLGKARLSGVDLGANFVATQHLELRGTLSTVKLSDLEVPAGSEEATALNAPGTKWTLGSSVKNVGPWSGGLTYRNVNAYFFRSGTNVGVIPTFGTLDASLSFKVPRLQNMLLNASVSNLYSCTATNLTFQTGTTPANSVIATEDRGCGLNRKHREMVNMPEIGLMAFVGVRVTR
jgi:iron complex outermembrane receptor protein